MTQYRVMVRQCGADAATELCRCGTKESAEQLAYVAGQKKTSGRRHLPIYEHTYVEELPQS